MDEKMARSVSALELARYLGLWYEQGRLPLRFEDDEARDVTAEYSLADDGTVTVDNRCLDKNGEPERALGQAIPDPDHPGRLRVSFLPEKLRWLPFTRADYWVLRVDEDYEHALVGTPDHRYLWLLSRQTQVDDAVAEGFLQTARDQGFDLTGWITTPQSGAVVAF
ncbi:lipocalin family protein [Microbacterium sp. ZW T6_19]|uniref:lipocalin family protein n=1 Tax=Microbacterium sp. ZW T6_19 TaxID=3378082 RepID=UPI003854943F